MREPAKKITREELYEAVWSKPIKSLEQEWNTTHLQVVQACLEMDVPRPSQGHWQMVALGSPVERDPLPERTRHPPRAGIVAARGAPGEEGSIWGDSRCGTGWASDFPGAGNSVPGAVDPP
jgi:hypothetical protein